MADGKAQEAQSPQQKHERKQAVQTHGRASVTRSIAKAVVIKEGDIFYEALRTRLERFRQRHRQRRWQYGRPADLAR